MNICQVCGVIDENEICEECVEEDTWPRDQELDFEYD